MTEARKQPSFTIWAVEYRRTDSDALYRSSVVLETGVTSFSAIPLMLAKKQRCSVADIEITKIERF